MHTSNTDASERKTRNELDIKRLATEKLTKLGAHVQEGATLEKLSDVIEVATGLKRPYYTSCGDFVQAFAVPAKARVSQFDLLARKPLSGAHPRLADIDRAQPPMMTPRGVGNGTERVHGYGRGY